MLRLLVKAVLALLILMGVSAGAIYAWIPINERLFDRALARAEAANAAHWETGTALRVNARLVQRSFGKTVTREETLDCFQKQVVTYRRFGGHLPETRSQSTFRKSLFTLFSEDRSFNIAPDGTLCTELFRAGETTDQSSPFSGDIVINPLPSEDSPAYEAWMLRQGPACRLNWTAGTPLSLDYNLFIDDLTILSVEEVPLRHVLREPDHMGSARDTTLRIMAQIGVSTNLEKPARFDWNQDELCWLAPDEDRCSTQADELCGIPKL